MNGAVRRVGGQVTDVKCLVDDSLTSEGSITVQKDAHRLVAILVATIELFGASFTLNDRIHG